MQIAHETSDLNLISTESKPRILQLHHCGGPNNIQYTNNELTLAKKKSTCFGALLTIIQLLDA
jgi:hypothetical protein